MRILLTADPELTVPPQEYGGIERIVAGLAQELNARGHDVGLVARAGSTVTVNRFYAWRGETSRRRSDTARNLTTLYRAVQDFKPDVLHSFSRLMYMLPLLPTSLPKIMSYQREPAARQIAWAANLTAGSLNFTGCSDYICRQGKVAGGTWHAIHNFTDVENYCFTKTVSDDAPLVFLSRIEPIKGADIAIAAALRTHRKIIVAGNYSETGSAGHYWREKILPQLNNRDVEYVGSVNDRQKSDLLSRASAMIVPIQWNEPFGIVFAEALACGTPVIACPRGAVPEIVRHGVEGFHVNTLDEACQAIENVKSINRLACRQRAEDAFSTGVIVNRYEHLYRTVTNLQ